YAKRVAGEQDLDEETLLAEWQSPGFDLAAASQVALGGDGQIVAYADFFGDRGARLFGWAAVHPDYFNRGLGTRLMDWIDVRARRAAEKLPEELEVILQTSVYAQDAHGRAFLEALGMQPVRRFWTMAAALDGPPARPHFPNGFEVRPMASMAEFPAVIQALRDAFQDHWGNVEVSFEQEYEGWLHRMESAGDNPMHWILALDGPEVAGLVAYRLRSYEDPDMAWVAELAVRRPWRRRGLGLALLLEAFGHLDSLGARRVGLGVDSQSLTGATELYRKAGMRVKTERDVYEKLIRPGRPAIRRELESAAA
ncbi:MAG: GNAT family N-acetyltransferase, partial [Candidatus Promineifilaceae bacterium]